MYFTKPLGGEPVKKTTEKKKPYQKPRIERIGSLKELSQTDSNGGKTDGGAFPVNKHMCLTPPSVLEEHRFLLADVNCQMAFADAILDAVKPGDVVLDLGTGSGLHALFALRAGARKVYAIDVDPLIHEAEAAVAENGFEGKVHFIQGNSRDVELPEKVDVLISNIGFLGTVNDLPDAIARFLKPGGRAVPDGVTLSIAPVFPRRIFNSRIGQWTDNAYGFKFSGLQRMAANHPIYWTMEEEDLIVQARTSAPLRLTEPVPQKLSWNFNFSIIADAECGGLGGWYSFLTAGREFLSTKPPLKMSKELWNHFFLPFPQVLQLKAGDQCSFQIDMHREAIGEAPIWRWRSEVNGVEIFDQNSFAALPLNVKA